jgi:septum formation protein
VSGGSGVRGGPGHAEPGRGLVRFVLASASPARRETLLRAGIVAEVFVSNVDESLVGRAGANADHVQNLASLKAAAVSGGLGPGVLVLGCDSMLEFEGELWGKPADTAEAIERWQRMRGNTGTLLTGHCLTEGSEERTVYAVAGTQVTFADVSDWEIELYVGSGEPDNVAGGFTIDGFGGWFVEAVRGDPHNVVGLSLPLLRRMLAELGYGIDNLGYPTA